MLPVVARDLGSKVEGEVMMSYLMFELQLKPHQMLLLKHYLMSLEVFRFVWDHFQRMYFWTFRTPWPNSGLLFIHWGLVGECFKFNFQGLFGEQVA